ncbi:ESPR-type extended signal peptide-containing protein [Pseudomonas fluorescens]|uniref:ESPR domain-containing protein n=1 Tax=Pseudomonas fluorescens TaxID=294 RepID=A0A5E7MLF7_PSEFL|nr:ESPR-type extended signal peptide-containing protein [Pseudomonas fluorescens]VVP25624.1 hypothetical protein PS880_04062 [Pseudomonas fluorescens]
MNKAIYRLVWNSTLGAPQVVSEVAKSKACGGSVALTGSGTRSSKRSAQKAVWPLALLSLGVASSVWALPSDVTYSGAISGVYYSNNSSIGTLTNNGTISGTSGAGISNSGSIGTLSNNGTISAARAPAISNSGIIGTLSNAGTIQGSAGILQSGRCHHRYTEQRR